MSQVRSKSPRPGALQARAALAASAGVVLAWAAATLLREALTQDAAYARRAALVAAALLAVAVFGIRRGHPFTRIGRANLLTGGRAVVTALLAGVAFGPDRPATGWLLVAIATTGAVADAADGPLARRSGLASRFGARFDMEVDALVILVLSVLAWRAVPLGAWVLVAGLLRYVFVAAGWALPWLRAALPPSRRRQALCVVQISSLIVALAPPAHAALAATVAAAGLGLLVWSFAIDVGWLWRRRPAASGAAG